MRRAGRRRDRHRRHALLVDSVIARVEPPRCAIKIADPTPQFVVRRDLQGQLLDILGTLDAHEAPADAIVESWMHIEIGGPRDANAEESLRRDIVRVLHDVRDAVDWERMRALATQTAAAIEAEPPKPVPASETAEVAEFLRWLAADHFTFLGCRDYRLVDDDEGFESLAAVAGSGLGLLRCSASSSRELRTQLRAARSGADVHSGRNSGRSDDGADHSWPDRSRSACDPGSRGRGRRAMSRLYRGALPWAVAPLFRTVARGTFSRS